jgi:hypothetical protein
MQTDMGADIYDGMARLEVLDQDSRQGLFVDLRSHTEKPCLQTNTLPSCETETTSQVSDTMAHAERIVLRSTRVSGRVRREADAKDL